MTTTSIPATLDLFGDDVLADPYPTFARLREAGPAVWIPAVDSWAITRYADVHRALADHETYSSSAGVGLNDAVNQAIAGTVLCSEPPQHERLRAVLGDRLAPKAVRALAAAVQAAADRMVETLLERASFDAVIDLAQVFTPTLIGDLIGVPREVRSRLLPWGNAVFDAMGPANERTTAALPLIVEQATWLATVRTEDLGEGSMGRAIYEAADAGLIDQASAPPLFWAYVGAGLDTTISAIGSALWLLAAHPPQFQRLRADPGLIPAAFSEVLRLESPIQVFSRVLRADVTVEDTLIPAGQRVLLFYGSANRDQRHFGASADEFDITRTGSDHLAFGYGRHGCPGQSLARIQAHAVLGALVEQAEDLRLTGAPVWHLNNTMRSLERVPVAVRAPGPAI